ncbi:uncharacterized protein DDB_G0288805-like [Montipora capricornis]|uniref:uncharacterized protein DDB_G0288805-like n=1 Tax=Montipora capricornis TaxID=246305 RepID=UPI0035F0FC91
MGCEDEHSDSRQTNLPLFSDSPSAKAQTDKKNERTLPVSICCDPCFREPRDIERHNLLIGHTCHVTRKEEGQTKDCKEHGNDPGAENVTEDTNIFSFDVYDQNNNSRRCCVRICANDGDCVDIDESRGDSECDIDLKINCNNDINGKRNCCLRDINGRHNNNDDRVKDVNDDDDYDDDEDKNGAEDGASEDGNNKGYTKTKNETRGVSSDSEKDATLENQKSSLTLRTDSRGDEEICRTERFSSSSNLTTHDVNISPIGGSALLSNNVNSQATAPVNKSTSLRQGARPKTTFPRTPLDQVADRGFNHTSLAYQQEDTGIRRDFLARHTIDVSLPYSSQPSDWNFSGVTGSRKDRLYSAFNSKGNSASWWSFPEPWRANQRAYFSGLQQPDIRNLAASQDMGLKSNWQLSYPQSERNATYTSFKEQRFFNRLDPWNANKHQSLTHGNYSGTFPGAPGNQINSSNAQAWMPSSPLTDSHFSNHDIVSCQVGYNRFTSNEHAVEQHTAAISEGHFQLTSSMMSQSVRPNGLTAPVIRRGNEDQRTDDSVRLGQSGTANQERGHLNLSGELTSRNGEPQEGLPSARRISSRSSVQSSSEDGTLVALGRKVAEACSVVERVMKERDERIKAQREVAVRERERRERIEREERERREMELREREAREREEREREARETRERQERQMREREASEIVGRERTRHDEDQRKAWNQGERAPIQESSQWQCRHYQRLCSVSFPCCGVFYPCHRCHNDSGACDVEDLKANQATHVKCGSCGHEEQINERSQHCSICGSRFSEYFCFKCKHFTGAEKNPFHCDKCGICRIHRDKSFHCDVCNVCLDKRLEGNHKCRPNSGHDECCICLEDAFSGCQILPCSHKVHKDCAIAMIQNGIRNCPICRHPLFNQES